MQEMSKMMAEDPQFKSSAVAMMNDPKMKKLHEDAGIWLATRNR